MLQLYDALFRTAIRLGDQYGRWLIVAVVVFVGGGFVLHLLARVLSGGGPKQP
jgi:hypothetical protein